MAEVKVFYDRTGNTLTVWFGNPEEEYVCEETGDEVILMKDKSGRVIGFERLNFSVETTESLKVAFEAATA
ncbi:MAG TPA: DUF2283 domain-containing protein [Syntrophales bacterium]|jgi:uncharacterized protein YuzE|nr:DUF2283 domain-containing protein [Syntrophales bacterium]HQL90018.1 DUF2283 domain-containing protein [Syntrophales bacterium]